METMALGAVPAALNFTLKSAQAGFELQQVPKETRELFRTISSIRADIVLAKEKRVSLAKICNAHDIAEWDVSIKELESALSSLEQLVESARVDMQHNKGKVKLKTKAMWMLRDSKSLSATHDRLSLAYARMGFCYQKVQFSASQTTPESGQSQREGHEYANEPPPSYQESTSRAVAARRREEKEKLERSGSVNTISDYTPSSGSNTPGTSGFTSPRSPRFEHFQDRQTPAFASYDGLQNVIPSASTHPQRLATTSAVHLPSNKAYQRDRDSDPSPNVIPAQRPPIGQRPASMPHPKSNPSSYDRAAYQQPTSKPDYSPTLLSPQMSQVNISSPRSVRQPESDTMSTFSFDQRRSSREGLIISTPLYESQATTLRGTPEPFSQTYASAAPSSSRRYQAPIEPPIDYKFRPRSNYGAAAAPPPQQEPATQGQNFQKPPTSSRSNIPPNPVSRQNTIQTQSQPQSRIPPQPQPRSSSYSQTQTQPRYQQTRSYIRTIHEDNEDSEDDKNNSPTPPHSPSPPPSKFQTTRSHNYDDAHDDMYDKPHPPLPSASAPAQSPFSDSAAISKTQRLFAGQRGAKEIKFKPYVGDEGTGSMPSSGMSMQPEQEYQAYRPQRDSHNWSEASKHSASGLTTGTDRSCF